MVFSSIPFLYYFLPITLLLYFIISKNCKNIVLLIVSLFFYFYGESRYLFILIFSCFFNYYYGKYLERKSGNRRKILFIINLIINFGILFYFKYFHFFLENINSLFHSNLAWVSIIMPIGISFFTFQATSYVIDIYRGKIKSAKNILIFATYLSLFPQLIAGPIVRYETVEQELKVRKTTFSTFANGTKRFIIGLSKKVLIANVLGEFSKSLMDLTIQSIASYWLQAISNMLQIYFDFSGYSDMAIGLGLMLGFHFLENFNYPFIAKSITDFWRRWHISLSSWFRDYIYIPLGGSRVSTLKRYRNILIVWIVTGLWHGASWNFILWGLYFAIFLILEKIFLLKVLRKHKIIGHIYTLFFVLISFIIFNENSMASIIQFLRGMFGFNHLNWINIDTFYYFKNYIGVMIFAIIFSIPCFPVVRKIIQKNTKLSQVISFLDPIIYMLLFLVVTAYIVDESFNPFLYFRF